MVGGGGGAPPPPHPPPPHHTPYPSAAGQPEQFQLSFRIPKTDDPGCLYFDFQADYNHQASISAVLRPFPLKDEKLRSMKILENIKHLDQKSIRWVLLAIGLVTGLLVVILVLVNRGAARELGMTQPTNPQLSATLTATNPESISGSEEPPQNSSSEASTTATITATPAPPAWEGFPGPTTTAVTEIPPPMRGVELPPEVKVVLLLGTDTESPRVGRTDTIILALYNPRLAKASLLSIPRDLLVYLPGYEMDRINRAYPLGGIDLLSLALQYNFNLVPDNYLLVHLNDFVAFVDDLGGVDIYIPVGVADENSSIPAGQHHLTGPQALFYVHTRKESSDIDRNRRQHGMIRALTRTILRGGNLVQLPAWYAKYSKSVVTNFTLLDLLNYIPLALQFGDESRVQFMQIGWENVTSWRTSGGAAVLLPKPDHIQGLLADAIAFVSNPVPFNELANTLAAELTISPTPTMTPSQTATPTPTSTETATITPTQTPDLTQTALPSLTLTNTPMPSDISPSHSVTPTMEESSGTPSP